MIELKADRRVFEASGEIVAEDRRLADEARCQQSSSLETTFVSDTQGYGVMFTVTGKQDMLLVVTLEISAVVLADNNGVHVMVYTKEGSYEDFEGKPGDWVKVADTVIVPTQDGQGTLIPPRDFHPVQITPRSQRAFYVTLDSTDLRYSNSPGRPVGTVFVEDNFLQVHVGAGLLQYPFSNKVFSPRVFCGIVHYRRMVDCNKVAVVDTTVSYHFVVQHDSLSDSSIQSTFNSIVGESITALIRSKLELAMFKEYAALKLDSVDTLITSSPFNAEAYSECTTNTVRTCSAVVSHMHFTHTDKVNPGELTYHILQHRAKVSSSLDTGHSMDVVYVGIIPMKSDMVVRIKGVPPGQSMNANQVSFFEKATQRFLEDKLSRLSSLSVLNVRVEDQLMNDPRRLTEQSQGQGSQATSPIDVFAVIMGSVKPPSSVDFDMLTEDAIDANSAAFVSDLKSRCDLTLESMDCSFFVDVSSVSITPMNGTSSNSDASNSDASSSDGDGRFLALEVCFFLLIILKVVAIVYYLWRRRRQRKHHEKEDMQRQQMPLSEDTDLSPVHNDEYSFDDFIDEDEVDLVKRPVLDGNRRGVATWDAHLTSLASTASWSDQASSFRDLSAAHSANMLTQRSSMSQHSASSLGAVSTNTQSKGGLIARGSRPDINDLPEYSASRRSSMEESYATGLKSIYRPIQRGSITQGSSSALRQPLDHWSSQRSLSLHDSNANLNQSTGFASRASMSQSSEYASSQRSLVSQYTRENRSISSSKRDLASEMRHPGLDDLGQDGTVLRGASEPIRRKSDLGVRRDGSSSNLSEYKSGGSTGLPNVPAAHRYPSQASSHVGDSLSVSDVSLSKRSAATANSSLTYSGHAVKRDSRVRFSDSLSF